MPTRTPPVHTTAPTPAYPGHYPRPWLLGRSHLMTWRTADHLLAEIWPREPGWGFAVPAGRWSVTVGPCCPPGPHRGAYHGRGSPWPLGPCPFGPSLAARFGWSVLTTVQEHVRVPTHSDLAHRHRQSGSASSCCAPLARPMPPGVRGRHEGGAISHAP